MESEFETLRGKFGIENPIDTLMLFPQNVNNINVLNKVLRTKAASEGRVRFFPSLCHPFEAARPSFHGARMFVQELCARTDDHHCGALHLTTSNKTPQDKHMASRVQLVNENFFYLHCGVRSVILYNKKTNERGMITAVKMRTCMCGELVASGVVVIGPFELQVITLCKDDYSQVTVNPMRNRTCKLCHGPSSSYEATFSWIGGGDCDEHYLKHNLCYNCAPVSHIFSMLKSKGYEPSKSKEFYQRQKANYEPMNIRLSTDDTHPLYRIFNCEEVSSIVSSTIAFSQVDMMFHKIGREYIRDLTKEGIESNPGPVDCIKLLNEHAQKTKNPYPTYSFEQIIADGSPNFRCVAEYMGCRSEGTAISKKLAKHAAASVLCNSLRI